MELLPSGLYDGDEVVERRSQATMIQLRSIIMRQGMPDRRQEMPDRL